jgi:hypothetical protein
MLTPVEEVLDIRLEVWEEQWTVLTSVCSLSETWYLRSHPGGPYIDTVGGRYPSWTPFKIVASSRS